MQEFSEPQITPLARRLAEGSGVAWHTLAGEGGDTITERDVLEHLTQVVTNTLPTSTVSTDASTTSTKEEVETIDFSLLAASLSEVLRELLVVDEGTDTPPIGDPAVDHASADPTDAGLEVQDIWALLEAERRAHAETQRQLGTLKEAGARQKARAEQLRPLSNEIRRLGSALGVANAEMERLRPLEPRVASLQKQLEETRADEARVRLLCRELQLHQEWLEEQLQKPPRWQFWRRTS